MNKTSLNNILYVNKCYCIGLSVAIAQLHLYFLSCQITHNNTLLLLQEMHIILSICFLVFLPALSKILANLEQKIFYRPLNS